MYEAADYAGYSAAEKAWLVAEALHAP